MLPTYDELREDFRAGMVRFPESPEFLIAFPSALIAYEHLTFVGGVSLLNKNGRSQHYGLFADYEERGVREAIDHFRELAVMAGAKIPLQILDSLNWCDASDAFSWWFAAICWYACPKPLQMELAGCTFVYKLFELSVRTIERWQNSGRIAGSLPEGQWSAPMSQAEIARRYTNQKGNVRGRQLPKDFERMYEVKKVSANKRIVRIDSMPPDLRRRFAE